MPALFHEYPVRHTCGHELIQVDFTQQYDVTSTTDLPESMRGTFVKGFGWVGGVPFDQLPLVYHKLIPGLTENRWQEAGEYVLECPSCRETLDKEHMTKLVGEH